MKLKTLILSMVILVSMGCKQRVNKEENTTSPTTEIVHSEEASDDMIDWVDAINDRNKPSIENMYAYNAIKVVSVDSIIESSSEIATYYKIKKDKITSIESLFHVEASKNRGIHYELIRYTTEDLKEYVQVVIWRLDNERVLREFEFTEISSPEAKKMDTNEIADRRKLWIELCNAHNAENLVKQLYSSNTMYFNHKPIVKGVENLIQEYGYMNNSDYALHLEPMTLEVVNANFAYEIGQCRGSYNGKYLLVWKKQSDGHWKIHIDSNI